MRGGIAIVLLVAALEAAAQESAPETRGALEAVNPLMARARVAGGVDADTAVTIVEALLKSEHAIAAPWWLALAEASVEKPGPAEKETLARLRRACEKPESFAEERKVALKIIRQTESLVADKNWEGARQAAATARGFLALLPDAGLTRLLETAEKRIPPRKPEDGPATRPKLAWAPGLEAEAAATAHRLIDLGAAAYRDAGCRAGRHALSRGIRQMAAVLRPVELAAALGRVRELAPSIEPNSVLTLFVRTVGTARLFREGAPKAVEGGSAVFDAEKQPLIELPVLPGDVVTIALDEAYSTDDIEGKSFVMALNARFEGRDLGPQHLFADLGPEPGAGTLIPIPIALKKPNPPKALYGRSADQDEALRAFNSYFELPKTSRRSVDVPCLGDMITFAKHFNDRKLGIVWIGTEADRFAVVIKVPEG